MIRDLFRTIEKKDKAAFEPFAMSNSYADTAFSVLYAWGRIFGYAFRPYKDAMVIRGLDTNEQTGFVILRKNASVPITGMVRDVCAFCDDAGIPTIFEYVTEDERAEYENALYDAGHMAQTSYSDDYSDYLYRTEDFISLSGNRFRTKRGAYNYLTSHYPAIRCESYRPDMYDDCIGIFDRWCASHDCSQCRYGCEKRIFERYMEIYDEKRCFAAVAYDRAEPLSFIVCERINPDTVSCLFQKNAKRIRGLTYWLNRQTAMGHPDIKYINLGEDMGLSGLRTDKTALRPCAMLRKYTIRTGDAKQ